MMAPFDPQEVERIAKGLTDEEAHLLKQMRRAFSIHPGRQSEPVRLFLRKAEIELKLLTNPSFDNYFLTPLGLAVRKHPFARDGMTHTKGPWFYEEDPSGFVRTGPAEGSPHGFVIAQIGWGGPNADRHANARLIAAAPDHALIGWAMCVGAGRWEPFGDGRGEFCINGIRHATKLDEFGVPEVSPSLRAAILKAQQGGE